GKLPPPSAARSGAGREKRRIARAAAPQRGQPRDWPRPRRSDSRRMALLHHWLGEEPRRFFERDFGRNPRSRPDAARAAAACCTWSALDAILSAEPAPDVLVIARGREVAAPVPRSLAQLGALFADGIGIVVRHA